MQNNGKVASVLLGSRTALSDGTPMPVQFCLTAVAGEYFYSDRWDQSGGNVLHLARKSARRLGDALVRSGVRTCRVIDGQRYKRKTREVVVIDSVGPVYAAYVFEGLRAAGCQIEAVQVQIPKPDGGVHVAERGN